MSDQEAQRAARYSDLFGENHEHPSNCAYCPICATIAVVRETRPELLDHLAAAARELVAAAGILVDEAAEVLERTAPEKAGGATTGDGKVRKIDIG